MKIEMRSCLLEGMVDTEDMVMVAMVVVNVDLTMGTVVGTH